MESLDLRWTDLNVWKLSCTPKDYRLVSTVWSSELEVVESMSLSLCPCYVCVIVINQNCQKQG